VDESKRTDFFFWSKIALLRQSSGFLENVDRVFHSLSCEELEDICLQLETQITKIERSIDFEKLDLGDDAVRAFAGWVVSMGAVFFKWIIGCDKTQLESFVALLHGSDIFWEIFEEGERLHVMPRYILFERNSKE
jgi:hypothetical protein